MIDPPGTCCGVCNTPLPVQTKNLIIIYWMNLKPGTCRGVCNTPLPVRIKNLIPFYWMNLKPDMCWYVCNTPLPVTDKYLINTYLLNLIPGKDWIVRVGAYYIRSMNRYDHRQMINPPDTCWGVCNMPLSIRIKNLIPIYRMNLKLDTCWGVCNTHLPIWDKYLINTYLLNPIPDKDWIVCVGAYCIRPTDTHDHGQMIDPPGTCRGVCNTYIPIRDKYLINMYLLNPILGKYWIVRVGAYCIRPTNAHDHGQMIDPTDTC